MIELFKNPRYDFIGKRRWADLSSTAITVIASHSSPEACVTTSTLLGHVDSGAVYRADQNRLSAGGAQRDPLGRHPLSQMVRAESH